MADISRADALALINQQDAREIWQAAPQFSAALRTFRRIPMTKKQTRVPVIASLPNAAFVSGEDSTDETSIKPTTKMTWGDRTIEAEEIAGIVVIPENVIADAESDFDLWGEVRPRIAEAVGITLDRAVFFGTNAPASWPDGLVPQAITADNYVVEGTSIPEGDGAANDLAADINETIGKVEDDGYDADVAFGRRSIRRRVRGLRDANNAPIYVSTLAESGRAVAQLYDAQFEVVGNGSWDNDEATLLVGDASFAVLGIRQDITYKFLDQATVTLDGELVSLAERDLLGLRFKMRVGFQTAETLTTEGGDTAFPFAALVPTAPAS